MRVFISHSSADKKFVRTLKGDLNENGINTWVDEDELDYGDSLLEKLELAIAECTHFIVVLSPASIGSDWVKLELIRARFLRDQALVRKIIPIKYRKCEAPPDISNLLYADLSGEVVVNADGGRVSFITAGYTPFFSRLVKTLTSEDKLLTELDRTSIREQMQASGVSSVEIQADLKVREVVSRDTVRFYLRVIGYKNREQVAKWKTAIKSKSGIGIPIDRIVPILLPSVLQMYGVDFMIGDEVSFQHSYLSGLVGHFGGFKKNADTSTIALPDVLRRGLNILEGRVYLFEFDLKAKRIIVI